MITWMQQQSSDYWYIIWNTLLPIWKRERLLLTHYILPKKPHCGFSKANMALPMLGRKTHAGMGENLSFTTSQFMQRFVSRPIATSEDCHDS